MRKIAKVDANQSDIVAMLRKAGATVQSLHTVGGGCPDLLVGLRGRNWLLEVKDGKKPPSARRLTKEEQMWHDTWRGDVRVVTSPMDALLTIMNSH